MTRTHKQSDHFSSHWTPLNSYILLTSNLITYISFAFHCCSIGNRNCTFVEERKTTVESPHEHSIDVEEKTKKGFLEQMTKTTSVKHKITTDVIENVWSVEHSYNLFIYSGSDPTKNRVELQSRTASSEVVTSGRRTKAAPYPAANKIGPFEVSLSWLLRNVSGSTTAAAGEDKAAFKIDRDADTCKTPRRNEDSETALELFCDIGRWCKNVVLALSDIESVGNRDPSIGDEPESKVLLRSITSKAIFVPVLPLFEEKEKDANNEDNSVASETRSPSPLLSSNDVEIFLSEQCRSLDAAISSLIKTFPESSKHSVLVSSQEAKLYVLALHTKDIVRCYSDGMNFIESMLTNQLEAAIGRTIDRDNFYEYMSTALGKILFKDVYVPTPFSFAVRRPDHSPDGAISIERFDEDGKAIPIITAACKVDGSPNSVRMPINAATSVELTGSKYLHGWMNCRFGASSSQPRHQLTARARQFSSFMLVIGTISGPDTFEPREAIIVSNKDELFLPLILEELPTAKAFKDAISSLSAEQRRFAEAFRAMQLSSSVFGMLTIQLKPQLEALLGLPPCSLTKEVRLSEDLLSLFIDYQIPSDLLSYDGPDNLEAGEKAGVVKKNAQNVLEMIEVLKADQIKEQQAKADMAFEMKQTEYPPEPESITFGSGHVPVGASSASVMRTKRSARSAAAPPTRMVVERQAGSIMPIPAPVMLGSAPLAFGSAQNNYDDYVAFDMCMEDEAPIAAESRTSSPSDGTLLLPGEHRQTNLVEAKLSTATKGTDFTAIPKTLDKLYEEHDTDDALRATTIKVGECWNKKSQTNLLSAMSESTINVQEEKNAMKAKAFDLLDALSRSGALPIVCSELHVIVCSTYGFERSVVETVVRDNMNPIEKLETAFLLLNSAIRNIEPKLLLKDDMQVARLSRAAPKMISAGIVSGSGDDDTEAEANA